MNLNIDIGDLFKKNWRDISFVAISMLLLLFGILLFPSQAVELRANLILYALPFIAGGVYFKKSLLDNQYEKPSKKLVISISILGGVAVITYFIGFFLAYNLFNEGSLSYAQSLAKVVLVLFVVSAVASLTSIFLLARNSQSLPLVTFSSYFFVSGLIAAICCGIGTLTQIATIPVELPDLYKEQLVASLMHLVSGVGVGLIMCGAIIVISRYLPNADKD